MYGPIMGILIFLVATYTHAVNMFLDREEGFISEDAVLVTLTPLEISGVKVDKDQFPPFVPYG